jgi:hypothetical protein
MSKKHHLDVVLRVPAVENATIPEGFTAELQKLLGGFDEYLND